MNKYTVSTILAGILWGIISIFIKNLSLQGFSSLQIMLFRAIISAIILLIYLLIKNKNLLKIKIKDIWMFIGTGVISLTFFSLCYFQTILNCGASIAVILLYTSPIFVLFLSAILFKEKITVIKILALLLTFSGCILVTGLGKTSSISIQNLFIGLCAGLGYALYSIFSRFALRKYNSLTVTFYTFVFSGLSLLPICKITQIPSLFTQKTTILALGIAFFCTVLPYILYTYGLSGLETGKAAIFVTIEPLVGTILGFFLWHEEISFLKILGIILIFVAVILLNLQVKQPEK